MNVLLINASPRPNGNTALALGEMEKIFRQEGIETQTLKIGSQAIRGCIACNSCAKTGMCVLCRRQRDAVGVSDAPVLQHFL